MTDRAQPSAAAPEQGRGTRFDAEVAWLRGQLGPGAEAIETHFAWVFLVGDRAWKLRKPVRREPMDYGTLEARRQGAEAELRLNRRLAPTAYLGTQPLTLEPSGQFAIGGTGTVVDWLVEMRRLDRTRMLDVMLAAGRVADDDLRRVAGRLAEFYAAEPPALTDGAALQARLQTRIAANHRAIAALDEAGAARLQALQLQFLNEQPALLAARAAGGCVIEAHGDLRPEHILLADPPVVIDCLEFDRELRVMDRAEELAFLELECDRIGHAAAGRRIASACLARLGDDAPDSLLHFYRSHRAATRVRLCVWRAAEPDGDTPGHWRATARQYLAAALTAARRATGVGTPAESRNG